VAGSVAERCKLEAYFVYSIVLTVLIYPVVSHWIWDSEGWLSVGSDTVIFSDTKEGPGGNNNMVDFAGCAVVHMVGGWAGFVAAIVIGPRKGRFDSGAPPPHNVLFCSMGVLFLWFGWYGFNCGSTLGMAGNNAIAARVATTTTIAAASGCVTAAAISRLFYGCYDLLFALNGILAGLVSITAACHCVEPWAAFLVGIIGAIIYKAASLLLQKLKIDDPLDAAPVHGFCGIFGALVPGIFSSDALLHSNYGNDNDAFSSGRQFLTQLVGVLAVLAWVIVTSFILFYGIHKTIGLRVSEEVEDIGLDQSEHGGKAYNVQKEEQVELQAKA
jgi:Amt family ammonium transporter